jgi:hypothetical protein
VHTGVKLDSVTIGRDRQGSARMTLQLIGMDERAETASIAGTPTDLPISRFSQFNGDLLIDDRAVAAITGAELTWSNALEPLAALSNDGLGGIDVTYEGIAARSPTEGRLATVDLINDVAGY